jgi:hypothetical protein
VWATTQVTDHGTVVVVHHPAPPSTAQAARSAPVWLQSRPVTCHLSPGTGRNSAPPSPVMPRAGGSSAPRGMPRAVRRGASRRNIHTAAGSAGSTFRTVVRITLEVHPWFGREATVVGRRGREAVYVELPDGRSCYFPSAWTDIEPRPEPLRRGAQPVRLAPQALARLASWVSARLDRQKLDHGDREDQKAGDVVDRRTAPAAAVVGEAGATRARGSRRGHRRKRGDR